jgi:hypothetical protein
MTGPEHYLRAGELLSGLSTIHPGPENVATAQVHATLARAAAAALSSDFSARPDGPGRERRTGTSNRGGKSGLGDPP